MHDACFASSRACDASRAFSGVTTSVGPLRYDANDSRTAVPPSALLPLAICTVAGARQIVVFSAAPWAPSVANAHGMIASVARAVRGTIVIDMMCSEERFIAG